MLRGVMLAAAAALWRAEQAKRGGWVTRVQLARWIHGASVRRLMPHEAEAVERLIALGLVTKRTTDSPAAVIAYRWEYQVVKVPMRLALRDVLKGLSPSGVRLWQEIALHREIQTTWQVEGLTRTTGLSAEVLRQALERLRGYGVIFFVRDQFHLRLLPPEGVPTR